MIPALLASLALLAHSMLFASGFAIPKLLVLSLGLLPMAWAAWRGAPVDLHRSCFVSGLLFLFAVATSLVFAEDGWLGLVGRYNNFTWGLLGVAIAFFYHLAAASSAGVEEAGLTRENVRGLRVIAAAGAVLGVYAVAQGQGLTAIPSTLAGGRAIGTIGSPTDLGLVLALILPIAVDVSPVYALGVTLGLAASGARGAWLAAAIGLLVYALRQPKGRRLLLPLLVIGGVGVSCMAARGASRFRKSDAERIEIWKIARTAIAERPLIGHGPDSFGNAFKRLKTEGFVRVQLSDRHVQEDAHNDVLQVLATLGLFGLLAYVILGLSAFASVWSHPAGLGALTALFVNAKVNPLPIEAVVLAAVIVGLASGRASACDRLHSPKQSCRLPLLPGPRVAFAVVAGLIAGGSSLMAVADYYAERGDVASLTRAATLNPFELTYKSRMINATADAIGKESDPKRRGDLLLAARRVAMDGVRLRPAESSSWYIAGVEALAERELGVAGRDPVPYLTRARQLDPFFGPIRAALVAAKAL